jgi:hypothetical protein
MVVGPRETRKPEIASNTAAITGVLQWCYSGVTVVLRWCYRGVTWCYSDVTWRQTQPRSLCVRVRECVCVYVSMCVSMCVYVHLSICVHKECLCLPCGDVSKMLGHTKFSKCIKASCGVTVVLQWCYSGVTVVLQWCYSRVIAGVTVGVSKMLGHTKLIK